MVVAEDKDLQPFIEGCTELESNGKKCRKCEDLFILGSDGFCYFTIAGCKQHSGNACYLCE